MRQNSDFETDLFKDTQNNIDGFSGKREIHIGLDIGGPIGTEVFSFADGVVHSVGCNPVHGDYGYVVVIKHDISSNLFQSEEQCSMNERSLYALYGHLGSQKIIDTEVNDKIFKGDIIGFLGNYSENGGWPPHVHFQLSLIEPKTHDMPGVVSIEDREKSLSIYPDPQLVLGRLY